MVELEKLTRLGRTGCPVPFPQHVQYSITIPRADNKGRKIDPFYLRQEIGDIIDHFKGGSVSPGRQGCWVKPDSKELICEENIVVTAIRNYTKEDNETPMDASEACEAWHSDETYVNEKTEALGKRFGQYSVLASASPTETVFVPAGYKSALEKRLLQPTFLGFGRGRSKISSTLKL